MRYGRREQMAGLFHTAGGNQLADSRTGNHLAVDLDRRHDFQLDVGLGGELAQGLDRSLPIVAEKEIRAFDNRLGGQRRHHDRVEKISRAQGQQRFVGRIGNHGVDAQLLQQFRLAIGPGQRRRSVAGCRSAPDGDRR